MPDEWRVGFHSIEEVDPERIVELLRVCLGEGSVPRDQAFWEWKHRRSSFGPSPGLAAIAEGALVGLRVFLRWTWGCGTERYDAVRAVDTVTHPSARGRGLFRRLTEELARRVEEEGAAFVFNTPNRISRRGYLAMGWRDVGRVPVLVRPLWRGRGVRGGGRRGGGEGGGEAGGGGGARGVAPVPELLAVRGLDEVLAGCRRGEVRLHTPLSRKYLQWRYGKAPGGLRYEALWELSGGCGAFVIARPRARGRLREVRVCELVASGGEGGFAAARRVLRRLLDGAEADYAVGCGARGTVERRVLRSAGFVPVPGLGPRFTVRVLREGLAVDPTRWESWRLSVGDLEVF